MGKIYQTFTDSDEQRARELLDNLAVPYETDGINITVFDPLEPDDEYKLFEIGLMAKE